MALAVGPKRSGLKKPKDMLLPSSLASVESLTVPLVQEVVLSADIRCTECQKRVAEIMSRMNNTESISVNLMEKSVTLTYRYQPGRQLVSLRRKPLHKVAMILRIIQSACYYSV